MTDLDRLARAAGLLYGDRWQCAIARLLHVSDRLVRFWVAGSRPIPERVWWPLIDEMEVRQAALEKEREALASWRAFGK